MKARQLYKHLDKDFNISNFVDEWETLLEFNEFINPAFKERTIGVMLNNSEEIQKVYTSTFPDNMVLDKILSGNETDILLFSHHAMGYDPTLDGLPFYNIPQDYLKELQKRRISFYVMHMPLDRNGTYSTSMNLAKALQLSVTEEFCEYLGTKVGVICETRFSRLEDLVSHVANTVGHEARVRQYGGDIIDNGTVAIAAGGGCFDFIANELSSMGINTYLTGLTKPLPSFEPSMEFHRIARENRLNVIGATHYSTEKYACIAVLDYFSKLGVNAEFIEGEPCMEDL